MPALLDGVKLPEGWETKADGFIYARDQRVWPVTAIRDPSTRGILEPDYKSAFLAWMSQAGQVGERAWSLLDAAQQKALSAGTDTAGGFLVPPELAAEILVVIRERSIVRRNALVLTTTRDKLDVGELDFTAEWVGETPAAGETTITPIKGVTVNVYKVRAKAKVSRDLFSDQPALQGWLARAGGQAVALAEDQAFIAGSGVGRPLGFISQLPSTSIVDVEGSTADTISNTTAAAGSRPKLESLEAGLPDAYRVNARWFMAGATLAKVRGLVTPAGTMAFPSSAHPLSGEDMLMSHPVSTSSAMPLDGTNGNLPIALVDPRQYVVAARNMLSVRVDTETLADVDQVIVNVFDRIGGVLGIADAIRVGQV